MGKRVCVNSLTLMLGLSLPAVFVDDSKGQVRSGESTTYLLSYVQGIDEARRAIESGNPVLYRYGFVSFFECVDEETGLFYVTRGGCRIDTKTRGRIEGFNNTIRRRLQSVGSLDGSYKRWVSSLFDLRGSFEAAEREEAPARLEPGGEATFADLGRVVHAHTSVSKTGSPWKIVLEIQGPQGQIGSLPMYTNDSGVDLIRGPSDSNLVFLRYRKSGALRYAAIDIEKARLLRVDSK